MDHEVLKAALHDALEKCNVKIITNQEGRNSPKEGAEKIFTEALKKSLSKHEGITVQGEQDLHKWGGVNIKADTLKGKFDFLVEDVSENSSYAFEVKVVGFPADTSNTKGGYNVIQIGQDTLRLTLLNHEQDVKKATKEVGGGWIIILGIGQDLEQVTTDDEALSVIHNGLHKELGAFLEKINNGIGNFKDARSLGGCTYLGLREPYRKNIRPEHSYFAVKLKGTKLAAVAAWVGGE